MHEAIDAAISQAEANLRAVEAMHRQTRNDLAAQVILDICTIRDADRQLELFEQTILPRARQVVAITRPAYESGHASLLDVLDGDRSLISIQRLMANVRVAREKRLTDLEAITARSETRPALKFFANSIWPSDRNPSGSAEAEMRRVANAWA